MAPFVPCSVSVFGLGYVGCVSAACIAQMGHRVIGIDANPDKTELIRQGMPTIVENGIDELVREQAREGRLVAYDDTKRAIAETDVSIVCVGTPSDKAGLPDLTYIWNVARQIRDGLKDKESFHTILIRSTVPPGTCRRFEQIVEESGKRADVHFAVVGNPEFLREGSSIRDYFNPPYTLLGSSNRRALDAARALYGSIDSPIVETGRETAEMIKYVNNSFHALKVAFANEIGAICKSCGVDSHEVMELFCRDRRLNISPAYFKPGFAYGGSCLPKDLRALNAMARAGNVELPVLSSVGRSNERQIERALDIILGLGRVKIGVLGLAFKSGTDDLRESPAVKLLEQLIGKGYEVMIYDRNVLASKLMGTNKTYMEATVPHLTRWLANDLSELTAFADAIVVTQKSEEFRTYVNDMLPSKTIVDLVRIADTIPASDRYSGLVW